MTQAAIVIVSVKEDGEMMRTTQHVTVCLLVKVPAVIL